ncbi:GHKL domain-containing protein [Acholeplasma granularum]|uniref:GHKL domain-containing protein n=1 Tax=Acholeplasma granularum TaxID=264635 RepID=UPI00046FBF50|nr:GHKL domain-containing protein [Acholeplasma granularum]
MIYLHLLYACIAATIYSYFYIRIYSKFFDLRKYYYLGFLIFLVTIFIQFMTISVLGMTIGYIALLSFITYPIALSMIYRTNIFNIVFLSLNAILTIYVAFIFFAAIYASIHQVQFTITWIYVSNYYHLSQAHAYLSSLLLLIFFDKFILSDKLKDFFLLRRNLILIIGIQTILIINMIWISVSRENLPFSWYNTVLILIAFSVYGIYVMLRLFTANSTYFSVFKTHTETLKKQLNFQIEHYKNYEMQTQEYLKFRHDYEKILKGITTLLDLNDYEGVKQLIKDSNDEFDSISFTYKKYSNNLIIDALLNDYQKRFNKIGAIFDSKVYIHLDQEFSDINLIKLFYNILENSYESLIKVDDANMRIMKIESELIDRYIKISFINSMNIKFYDDSTRTSKSDKLRHGFGKAIIDNILSSIDGFSNRFITEENNISFYNLEIFIPIS